MSSVKQITKFIRITLAVVVGTATLALGAKHPKINVDLKLEEKNPDAQVNVIIQYKQGAQPRHL